MSCRYNGAGIHAGLVGLPAHLVAFAPDLHLVLVFMPCANLEDGIARGQGILEEIDLVGSIRVTAGAQFVRTNTRLDDLQAPETAIRAHTQLASAYHF